MPVDSGCHLSGMICSATPRGRANIAWPPCSRTRRQEERGKSPRTVRSRHRRERHAVARRSWHPSVTSCQDGGTGPVATVRLDRITPPHADRFRTWRRSSPARAMLHALADEVALSLGRDARPRVRPCCRPRPGSRPCAAAWPTRRQNWLASIVRVTTRWVISISSAWVPANGERVAGTPA